MSSRKEKVRGQIKRSNMVRRGWGGERTRGKQPKKKKTQKMEKSIEEIINISFPNKTFIRQLLNQEREPNIHHTGK